MSDDMLEILSRLIAVHDCRGAAEMRGVLKRAASERDDARRRLAEAGTRIERLSEMVARVQWSAGDCGGECPWCGEFRNDEHERKGHAYDCDFWLANTDPYMSASTPTAEPPRCKHGITGPCRRCATTGRDEP